MRMALPHRNAHGPALNGARRSGQPGASSWLVLDGSSSITRHPRCSTARCSEAVPLARARSSTAAKAAAKRVLSLTPMVSQWSARRANSSASWRSSTGSVPVRIALPGVWSLSVTVGSSRGSPRVKVMARARQISSARDIRGSCPSSTLRIASLGRPDSVAVPATERPVRALETAA